jgi:hypothetical protein
MVSTGLDYSYRYLAPSELERESGQQRLFVSTSAEDKKFPHFFEGQILQPVVLARLLSTVAKVVGTRYYVPPNMLNKILALADPIVTSGDGVLRFEAFSGCCSSYVRVDVSPNGYNGKIVGNGTTNVDFNVPLKTALAQTRDGDRLSLSVGPDEFVLRRGFDSIVERKVKLPLRWLKGLVEVQAYQSGMEHRYTLDRTETIKFLRSLPRSVNPKSSFVVAAAGKGLRLSQTPNPAGIPLTGLNRLLPLQDLAPFAEEMTIYADPNGQSSEWQLRCRDLTISITISAEVARGFSGEGKVLQELAETQPDSLARVRAALKWQSLINSHSLAKDLQLSELALKQALAKLGSLGLVGFDCSARAYFHRELPFDYAAVESFHPRLLQARKLVSAGQVTILSSLEGDLHGEVAGTSVKHDVRLSEQTFRCTCQWYAKHETLRGPCKHVLALQIAGGEQI